MQYDEFFLKNKNVYDKAVQLVRYDENILRSPKTNVYSYNAKLLQFRLDLMLLFLWSSN